MITLTAAAQTSRREGRQTSTSTKRTTEVRPETKQKSTKSTEQNRARVQNTDQRNSKAQQSVNRSRTTPNQNVNRSNTQNRSTSTTQTRTTNGNSNNRTKTSAGTTTQNKSQQHVDRNNAYQRTAPTNNNRTVEVTRKTTSNRVYHTDRTYVTPRTQVRTVYHQTPARETHHHHYVRRTPAHVDIVWDVHMHRDYCTIYPYVKVWRISAGTRIHSIPAYDAYAYVGDVMRVYGYVNEVYYDTRADEYHLYLGDFYPFQDFTVIVPGYVARRISYRPMRYFRNRYIWSTGYITEYERMPEMIVKRDYQFGVY